METDKIVEYMQKRRAIYEAHAEQQRLRQIGQPYRATEYAIKAAMSKASIMSIDHILYFIEHGEDHPDLVVPVQSEPEQKEEEPIVETEAAKPITRPARGRKPASKSAAGPGK